MAAVSSLAKYPKLIKRLFVSDSNRIPENGQFSARFCINGEWIQVTVDDLIPFFPNSKTPTFCKIVKNSIWPLILEKAYAKAYGSYQKTEIGFSKDALTDLTGAPCEYLDIRTNPAARDQIAHFLKKGFIMDVSSK